MQWRDAAVCQDILVVIPRCSKSADLDSPLSHYQDESTKKTWFDDVFRLDLSCLALLYLQCSDDVCFHSNSVILSNIDLHLHLLMKFAANIKSISLKKEKSTKEFKGPYMICHS